MNTLASSESEINKLLEDALPYLQQMAVEELHRRIGKYDLKLTDDLYNSFKTLVLNGAAQVQKEILISFNMYGRYKDLKYVAYDNFTKPNNKGKKYGNSDDDAPALVEAMEEMIKEVGISKFKYVPGYTTNGSNRMPVTTRAIKRLAWTLAVDRLRKPRVRNRKKGWYNEARAAIVNKGSAELAKRIRVLALNINTAQIRKLEISVPVSL